jgi:uncharacterized protein YuzE
MTSTSGNSITIHVTYDAEARASYQYVADKPIARTVERDGAYVDLAADGTVVGIERLYY